jgi:hypothetical protein
MLLVLLNLALSFGDEGGRHSHPRIEIEGVTNGIEIQFSDIYNKENFLVES